MEQRNETEASPLETASAPAEELKPIYVPSEKTTPEEQLELSTKWGSMPLVF